MKVLKPTVIILIAATLVTLVLLPVAQTDWADGLRESISSRLAERGGEGEGPSNGLRYVLPFVKELVFISVPGLLLLGVLRIKKTIRRKKRSV